jgi:ABC-type Mn2+/Zn2+ transport system ATPase subunit
MSPLLEVERLTVVRGGRPVVDDVSFTVGAGELVALVGPNGAGKSSLFGALLGLLPSTGGRISLSGSFAYVPQHEPAQRAFPVTALDVALMGAYRRVGLGRRLGRKRHAEALAALERVGLHDRADRSYGELSGGQRQRVLLARALVQAGTVLLLDEPLAGVDAVSEEAILSALAEQRAQGRAVVMATHDLGLARTRATQALLLNRTLYAAGPPDQALTADTLRAAYGDRLIVLDEDSGLGAIDEGSHHDHAHA